MEYLEGQQGAILFNYNIVIKIKGARMLKEKFYEVLKEEVVPAFGCTEPVAAA